MTRESDTVNLIVWQCHTCGGVCSLEGGSLQSRWCFNLHELCAGLFRRQLGTIPAGVGGIAMSQLVLPFRSAVVPSMEWYQRRLGFVLHHTTHLDAAAAEALAAG
jgi:hypothetical protein